MTVGTAASPAFTFGTEGVRPSSAQLEWHRQELGMFVHFGMFTYYGRHRVKNWNWRSFRDLPDPNLFNPVKLDCDQWMEAARSFGAKYVMLVVKHGDGFMLWQNDLYPYGVRQSAWRGGKGDVLADFLESCRKYGMKPGIYASLSANAYWEVDNPGFVNRGKGGDVEKQKRYNAMCERMMEQLWTRYGKFFEIWFDGGVIPVEKGGPDIIPILLENQPQAIVFQGPSGIPNLIRWVGNERGVAPYPCWHRDDFVTAEGGTCERCFAGSPDGAIWVPGECDIPMRNHNWFWKEGEDANVWPLDELVEKYETSVGRSCNLLLNANPNTDGLIPEADFKRYAEFGRALQKRYGTPLGSVSAAYGARSLTLKLPQPAAVSRIMFGERIEFGQCVRAYELSGKTTDGSEVILAKGSSVGHKRIEAVAPSVLREIILRVAESSGEPHLEAMSVF